MYDHLQCDLVVKGGTMIDGLQTPRYRADIGVRDGKVVEIGSNISVAAVPPKRFSASATDGTLVLRLPPHSVTVVHLEP